MNEENKEKYKKTQKLLLIVFAVLTLGVLIYVIAFGGKKDTDASKYISENASKHVTLGEYKGVAYTKYDTSVSDEEIENTINDYITRNTTYAIDESRKGTLIEDGDIVSISYTAQGENGTIENGSTNFEIGLGNFPEFEDAVRGQKVGDIVSLTAVVPEENTIIKGLEGMGGKPVKFEITLNYVTIRTVPERNDELAEKISDGECTSYDGLKDYFYEKYKNEREATAKAKKEEELITTVIANSEFKDIDWIVEKQCESVRNTYEELAENSGMTFEEYIEKYYADSVDTFEKELKETMVDVVKEQLVLQAVADKEKLSIKKKSDEYREYLQRYMKDYGYAEEKKFLEDYGEDAILQSMTYDKALNFIVENAVEKP